MKKEKILRDHFEKIIYSKENWNLLQKKRKHAIKLLEIFFREGFNPYVHGSIARGDTHESSDIDLVFFHLKAKSVHFTVLLSSSWICFVYGS